MVVVNAVDISNTHIDGTMNSLFAGVSIVDLLLTVNVVFHIHVTISVVSDLATSLLYHTSFTFLGVVSQLAQDVEDTLKIKNLLFDILLFIQTLICTSSNGADCPFLE